MSTLQSIQEKQKRLHLCKIYKKASLLPAIDSIIKSEGVMNVNVKGVAYFKLLGFDIPIPFESSKQILIYDEIKNRIDAVI